MGDHYIPRLLLRRFAADHTRAGQALVYQFRRGHPPPNKPFSVGSIASEAAFYDHPSGVSLDAGGMHEHETEAGRVLAAIENGASPGDYREELALFFSVMMSRTRAFREEVTQMFDTLLSEAHRAFAAPDWNTAIQAAVREYSAEDLFKFLVDVAPEHRDKLELVRRLPNGMELIRARVGQFDFSASANAWMSGLRSVLNPSVTTKTAQVDALMRVFHTRAITWHKDVRFEVKIPADQNERFILGDACVVAVGDEHAFGHPMKFGRSRLATLIPVGPRLLLLAVAADAATPAWSVGEINRASAMLSREFFFSAESGAAEASLLDVLGNAPPSVSCEEIRELGQETITRLWPKKNGVPGTEET